MKSKSPTRKKRTTSKDGLLFLFPLSEAMRNEAVNYRPPRFFVDSAKMQAAADNLPKAIATENTENTE